MKTEYQSVGLELHVNETNDNTRILIWNLVSKINAHGTTVIGN